MSNTGINWEEILKELGLEDDPEVKKQLEENPDGMIEFLLDKNEAARRDRERLSSIRTKRQQPYLKTNAKISQQANEAR